MRHAAPLVPFAAKALLASILLSAWAALWALPAQADFDPGPSYSCKEARDPVTRLVCDDYTLSLSDRELAEVYGAARAAAGIDASALVSEQRQWLKGLRPRCLDAAGSARGDPHAATACLQREYDARIEALRALVAAPVTLRDILALPTDFLGEFGIPSLEQLLAAGEFSQDGRFLALYGLDRDRPARRRIWIIDLPHRQVRTVAAELDPPTSRPSWPLGSDVMLAWSEGILYLADGRGAAARYSAFAATPDRLAPAPVPESLRNRLNVLRLARKNAASWQLDSDALRSDSLVMIERHLVWLEDHGGGRVELKLQEALGKNYKPLPAPREIRRLALGSWELQQTRFMLQPGGLLYPARNGLLRLRLAKGQAERLNGTAAGDLPLAWALDGRRIAWLGARDCAGVMPRATVANPPPFLCLASLEP